MNRGLQIWMDKVHEQIYNAVEQNIERNLLKSKLYIPLKLSKLVNGGSIFLKLVNGSLDWIRDLNKALISGYGKVAVAVVIQLEEQGEKHSWSETQREEKRMCLTVRVILELIS